MKPLLKIIWFLINSERHAAVLGLALSVVVLVMGAGLLGLSGWFITAAAAAGIAGIGMLFNVFAPSAMVRFLALGRTAARYGERLATHDAVLRALSALRLRLLQGLLTRPHRALERLRVASVLNRLTADVEALDGALLRLVLPGLAGAVAIVAAALILWWLVHPAIALVVGVGYLLGPNVVFFVGQRAARKPSRQTEAAMQATRGRLVELINAREDLTVFGRIDEAQDHCEAAILRHAAARDRLDAIERVSGLGLDLVGAVVTAAALGLGAMLVQSGSIEAARAAIGIFVALALAEAVAPIRRALTEIGSMVQAARRIAPSLAAEPPALVRGSEDTGDRGLTLDTISYCRGPDGPALFEPLSLRVAPGETVALTGPSGVGKSTVLLIAAGALAPDSGVARLNGRDVRASHVAALPHPLVMVPQRHGLISGTVAENLRLAAPAANDAALWHALGACCLAETLRTKGGLALRLGPRGDGLSGGEARRLVLARALLRQPSVLLLDEPTEGLDDETAARVMSGIRHALPRAAILMAAHRCVERKAADRAIALRSPVRSM